MKVVNNTAWNTKQLKAILQRAAEQELDPERRKHLHVTVDYTRGGYSTGCATVRGRRSWVRIQHPQTTTARYIQVGDDDPRRAHGRWSNPDGTHGKVVRDTSPQPLTKERLNEIKLHFASVAVHEFAHNRGMEHAQMPAHYKWTPTWRAYVAWAAEFPLSPVAPKATPKPRLDQKLAYVAAKRKQAETRVKRATTLLKKWLRKERYYTRQMAASPKAPNQ